MERTEGSCPGGSERDNEGGDLPRTCARALKGLHRPPSQFRGTVFLPPRTPRVVLLVDQLLVADDIVGEGERVVRHQSKPRGPQAEQLRQDNIAENALRCLTK